ncbi:MAG TPA: GIY-YIG nuclease family protein, partial [Sediminibacterium sp.]|nr:GIY-YIG nuclease family protein [Sediminibacterium sp.]
MPFYVYIIQSSIDGSHYKGFTKNPRSRIMTHNEKGSRYTSAKTPWHFVYLEELPDKRTALQREKTLKKFSHAQIKALIKSTRN